MNLLDVAGYAVSPDHYIDGARVASSETFELQSPIDQRVLGRVSEGLAEHVDAAIAAAQLAFPAWAALSAAERKPYLDRFAAEIGRRADAFCQLESNDAGVLLSRMRHGVVPRAMLNITWFANHALGLQNRPIDTEQAHHIVRHDPAGVVVIITPWNAPLMLATWKLGPALAAGNTVIVKPPEWAPLTSSLLADAADAAGLPPGVFNIVQGTGAHTGAKLVSDDGGDHFKGTYISEEMPWYLFGVPYEYRGHPELALAIEAVSREQAGYNRAVLNPELGKQYPTINLVKHLRLELSGTPVLTLSSCQNCDWPHFLKSGEAIGEAVRRSDLRVVMLASGALSHKFNGIDWKPNHPRIFHESNVSRPENIASDKGAIELMKQGRHDTILERWNDEYRKLPWEAFGAHYLQMLGAMGGAACRARGEALSDYENARGTGNIHVWFDL